MYLTERQRSKTAKLAEKTGLSESELFRSEVDFYLEAEEERYRISKRRGLDGTAITSCSFKGDCFWKL